MIVKMSKIEVIGPKELLMRVLESIQQTGVLEIDSDIKQSIHKIAEPLVRPLILDEETLAQRMYLKDLRLKIGQLLGYLPVTPVRETHLRPAGALGSIAGLVSKHITSCRELSRRREAALAERSELERHISFLSAIDALLAGGGGTADEDQVAVELKDTAGLQQLTELTGRLQPESELRTVKAEDGSVIGLLTVEKQLSTQLKNSLREHQIPEVDLPPFMKDLPFPEKSAAARNRLTALNAEVVDVDEALRRFAATWRARYLKIQDWLDDQLSLLHTSAALYETETCFLLYGWMPAAELPGLKNRLAEEFGDTVVIEEKEILQQDLEKIPVVLSNPPYFRPFELLISILPLPRYTSIDPTPFVGIFFPLFFGMILGDIGYGAILLLLALGLILFVKRRPKVRQAAQILAFASTYTIVFGWLYGECFGEFGTHVLGLEPICFERRTSIMPMLYFALAVGTVHILVGLALGLLSAWKGHKTKEVAFRLLSMLMVICLIGILASFFAPVSSLIQRPLIIAVLVIVPALLLTGGLLAPFEVLKHIGNIISYARIMAVGLTSVLLAYVANNLAGMAGSIWLGVVVAVLLHAFNILLGVFAPTIHALRLHYVEFFGKFMEPGGKQFRPLQKHE